MVLSNFANGMSKSPAFIHTIALPLTPKGNILSLQFASLWREAVRIGEPDEDFDAEEAYLTEVSKPFVGHGGPASSIILSLET